MKLISYAAIFIAWIVLFMDCSKQQSQESIFINGKIFTSRDETHFVNALAVSDGVIIAAGKNEPVLAHRTNNTRIIDLRGKTVIPGFHDAHLHFWSGAYLRAQVNLIGALYVCIQIG